MEKYEAFNPADYMETKEDVVAYIDVLAESRTPAEFLGRLRRIAGSEGMASLARETGLTRAGLYRALGEDGDPKLSTLSAILDALGLRLSVSFKEPA